MAWRYEFDLLVVWKQYSTHSLRLVSVKYCFHHSRYNSYLQATVYNILYFDLLYIYGRIYSWSCTYMVPLQIKLSCVLRCCNNESMSWSFLWHWLTQECCPTSPPEKRKIKNYNSSAKFHLGAIHTSELDRSEIDLSPKRSECERSNANWDRSKIDLNECEHFLKANWNRSQIDP